MKRRAALGAAIGAAIDATKNEATQEQTLRERVTKALQEGFELVPCPACGWHEPRTVKEARKRRLRSLMVLGATALIAGAGVFLIVTAATSSAHAPHVDPNVKTLAVLASGIGALMMVMRWILVRSYDVNALPKGSPGARFKGAPPAALVAAPTRRPV